MKNRGINMMFNYATNFVMIEEGVVYEMNIYILLGYRVFPSNATDEVFGFFST